ncbi:single-stranded DNA-binding protein [Ruminiclostridium papyrosolvens]|uniref:Single-stranded DNA-binding protein n=1 Tax=Ruminiclostridium papyrosolvens C7 TaxID=1330534 RepID=U4R0E6_9FIRM|nr:single-stranded DNA-binding protein [Ruminiclostridium papyrosolvens]EPR10131.1 single-stranded DNA-binding protein [Ruminiclostridium papyrosolvens C7]
MNKVVLMGRLTKDPELRYTGGNKTAVATFALAVNRRFTREGERKADFINIVAWDKNAEFCSKHFIKGLQVVVVGRIQTRTWDDNEGKRHYITEVIAEETYFADRKKSGEDGQQGEAFQGGADGFYPMDEDDFPPF